MLAPLTSFCCGCSLVGGVYLILAWHLAADVLYIACAVGNLVSHDPTFSHTWSYAEQCGMTAWCLVGLAFLLVGWFGVYKRVETCVRMYLYYMFGCFCIDLYIVLRTFIFQDACSSSSGLISLLNQDYGQAFLCGWYRIIAHLIVGTAIFTVSYVLWVLWSFADGLSSGLNLSDLSELLPHRDDVIGMKGTTAKPGGYPGGAGYGGTGARKSSALAQHGGRGTSGHFEEDEDLGEPAEGYLPNGFNSRLPGRRWWGFGGPGDQERGYGGVIGFTRTELPGPHPDPYEGIVTDPDAQGRSLFGAGGRGTEYPPRDD